MIKYNVLPPKTQIKFMQKLEDALPQGVYEFASYPARDGKMYFVSGNDITITWYARAPKIKSLNELMFNNQSELLTYITKELA